MHRRSAILDDFKTGLTGINGVVALQMGFAGLSERELVQGCPLIIIQPTGSKSAAVRENDRAPRSTRRGYSIGVAVFASIEDFRAGRIDAISEEIEKRVFSPGFVRLAVQPTSVALAEDEWDFGSMPGYVFLNIAFEVIVQQAENEPGTVVIP